MSNRVAHMNSAMTSPSQTGIEMNAQEIESHLSSTDTGVLSLGVENRGYGFPVSFTYDPEKGRIILGFVIPPESKKQKFVTETEEATFTVYSYQDVDSWTSVIATGPIQALEDTDDSFQVPDLFFRQASDAATEEDQMVDLDQFDRTWYAVLIETLSGRQSG